jgi:histidyl-tRNA synthetase
MPNIQRPRGTRDFGPDEMGSRRYVEDVLRKTAETFGYKEIATPTFEHAELFTERSGEDVKNEMYIFKDKGGRDLSLRPELTAPTMRFYAAELRHLPKPIKIYYFGNCFRYERPQSGRFREFWQFGAEIIGGDVQGSDADIVAMAVSSIRNAGLTEFTTRIGHLGILRALLEAMGIPGENISQCMHFIDKGEFDALYDLLESGESTGGELGKIKALIEMEKSSELGEGVENLVMGNEKAENALEELITTLGLIRALGVNDYIIDLGIARGLDYYTGMVFEIDVPSLGAEKQVCGGGAYELAELFGAEKINSTGFAIGFDRVMMALKNKRVEIPVEGITAYIIPLGGEAKTAALELAAELRKSKISCDTALGDRSIAKHMKFANAQSARFTIIIGEDELKSKSASVKNMESGEQITIPLDSVVEHIEKH